MGSKWLASYSIAPLTPRDAKLAPAHPHLMHAIKWGGDVSQAVVKDYLIGIKTRVNKLQRFVDPSISPTWEYTNPIVKANGYDVQALATRLAEDEYPGANITSVSVAFSNTFNWGHFLTRYYRSKQALGYNDPSTLNSPLDSNDMLPWYKLINSGVVGQYTAAPAAGFGYDGTVANYGKYFAVRIHTRETVKTWVPGHYETDNSTTPPTQVWVPGYYTYQYFTHDVDVETKYDYVTGTGGGSSDPEFVPGDHTPHTEHGYTPSFTEFFDDPTNPLLQYSTIYGDGLAWDYPHVELTIHFDNSKVTHTWYDMEKWNAEAGLEPITFTVLPDTTIPFIPIRLNKLNITDPSLKTNTIAQSIKKACRKLQMNPKEILNSIKRQGGMSLAQVEAQIDGEIADEAKLNQFDPAYVPPTPAERQQRIDDLLAQEQADALAEKNDIFIAFMTSLATENKWEKELLYWTFHRYYSDASLALIRAPGNVIEIEIDIPDLYYRFSFDRIELTTGASVATPPASLTDDKYALEIIYQLVYEPLYGTGTVDDTFYVYRGYDQVRMWYMDDTGAVTQMDIYKFSTSLGTPKDLETWDGTLPTDADDYYWAHNTIGDKTGDERDIAVNKHCIPIHREVLEARTARLPTDTPQEKVQKLKMLKRCYEYGVSFIVVELKKIHVPWWVSWVKAIVFIWTVTLQIFAIANVWNPVGWSIQALIEFVETQLINYVVNEIIGAVVEELVKSLPPEVAAIISIVIQIVKAGLSGKFDNVNNIELALELVDATSSGMQLIRSADNKLLAKTNKELDDKIKELDDKLEEAREYLKSLDPNYNTFKEGEHINQFNTGIHNPSDFIYEEPYYGDHFALLETPEQFINRTLRTANPGLVAINSPSVTTAMLLDPSADLDLTTV